jgi:peptidoglycan/xylan/chitin deacetylase (PgdA/CDA1 family)
MAAGRVLIWLASVAGLALLARSWFIGPVPLTVALAALAAYVLLATAGVLFPQLEMYGDVLWRGSSSSSGVALTFDDGPHPTTTRRILALLAERRAIATFFVVGEKVERYPDVVRELVAAGHQVGLHGFLHERLYAFKTPRQVERDIRRTQEAVERTVGIRPTWFRPPLGHVSPRTAVGARRAGVDLVAWSARGLDGVPSAEAERVARRLERGLRPGAIIMLHDASEREDFVPASVEALPKLLDAIERKGLRVVSLESMV